MFLQNLKFISTIVKIVQLEWNFDKGVCILSTFICDNWNSIINKIIFLRTFDIKKIRVLYLGPIPVFVPRTYVIPRTNQKFNNFCYNVIKIKQLMKTEPSKTSLLTQ